MQEDRPDTEQTSGQSKQPGGGEGARTKRQRRSEHLDHFYKINQEGQQIRTKQSLFDKLAGNMAARKKSKADAPPSAAGAIGQRLGQNKKLMIVGGVVLLLAILAFIIIPIIPIQMQRSGGYAAFQEENYSDAYRQLADYLLERPEDHSAAYLAAQSALFSGNEAAAKRLFNDLYNDGRLTSEPGVGYYYALLNIDKPRQAIEALNSLLQREPGHAGGRLLRGFLLWDQPAALRQARDDFLQLDEILRGDEDFSEIEYLYQYLQKNSRHELPVELPHYSQPVESGLQTYIGPIHGLDGLIYQLGFSRHEEIAKERLSAADIANIYFTYVLIRQNEMEEAQSVLTGLMRNSSDKLAVQQLAAFFSAVQGDYGEARDWFGKMAAQMAMDAQTLNNHALMDILATQGAIDISKIAERYEQIANSPNVGLIGLNNSAFFALLNGNYTAAGQRLGQIEQTDESGDSDEKDENNETPVQVQFNRALVNLVNGEVQAAKSQLAQIDVAALPAVADYVVSVYEKDNDLGGAIELMAAISEQIDNPEMELRRIRLINKSGEARVAYEDLLLFVDANPQQYGAVYLLGKLALRLGETEVADRQQANIVRAVQFNQEYYAAAFEGAALAAQGDNAAAAAAYYRAAENAPENAPRRDYLIEWATRTVETAPARVVEVLRDYVEADNHPAVLALLAYAVVNEDGAAAAAYADTAIAGGQGDYIVNLYAGGALVKIGNYQAALPLLEAAVSWQPAEVQAWRYLQQAALESGYTARSEQASRVISYLVATARGEGPETQAAYRINIPKNKSIADKMREVLSGNGNYEDALAVFAAELEKTADDPQMRADLLYSQATFESFHKQYSNAIPLFEEALALGLKTQEKQVKAMLFYAEVLSLTEQYSQAAQILQQIIELDGERLLYRRLYALALAGQAQREAAAELLRGLLLDYPLDRDTYYELAGVYADMEEYQVAIDTAKILLRIYPNHAPSYRLLTELYSALGKPQKGRIYSIVYSQLGQP